MGIKEYITGFVVAGIIIVSMLLFAYNFESANDSENSLSNDENTDNLQGEVLGNISEFSNDGDEINQVYYNSTLKEGTDSLIVPSQNTISTKSWRTPFRIVKSSMTYVYITLFGETNTEYAYIFGAVLGMLSIIAILYTIKFIRQGQE